MVWTPITISPSTSTVENIIIENITEPIAGETPTYTASIRGSGYKINTAKNSYYDAYWVNEKWYYIKNGIGWYDLTESHWVYENEKFIPAAKLSGCVGRL